MGWVCVCVCWGCAADPTGSMIVGMLSKKLESMAADSQRKQRLRRRAAARAQAAAPAAPGAAEGAAAPPPLASVPEQGEAAAGGVKEAPLGFGAALKRLLGDPQVGPATALLAGSRPAPGAAAGAGQLPQPEPCAPSTPCPCCARCTPPAALLPPGRHLLLALHGAGVWPRHGRRLPVHVPGPAG